MFLGVVRTAIRLSLIGATLGNDNLTRYYMYRHLSGLASAKARSDATVLSISHSDRLIRALGLASCVRTEAAYPEHDLTRLTFKPNSFDFVASDQVLEHIEGDPQRAFDETHRVLRPGGWAIHASCLLLPIHNAPSDLWRFTPAGLTYLARAYRKIIEVGSWGNKYVPLLIAAGFQFHNVPSSERRLLTRLASMNEPEWPCVVWIVAEK